MTSKPVLLDNDNRDQEEELVLNPLAYQEVVTPELSLPWSDMKDIELLKETSPSLYAHLQAVDRLYMESVTNAKQMHYKPFVEELLPLMMSSNPKEVQQGNRIFERIAGGLYNPIDLIDDLGNIIIRAPGARSRISAMNEENRIDLYGYLDAAFRIDQTRGGDRKTNEVLAAIDTSNNALFNYDYLLQWDKVITKFGYPSFFTEEERQYLGQPPIELYPGIEPITLGYSLVPKGKVSAQGKVEQKQITTTTSSISNFTDEDTEWGDE